MAREQAPARSPYVPAASGSTLSPEQTATVRRLLYEAADEDLAKTAESLSEQANDAAQTFREGSPIGDDAYTTAHAVIGPTIALLDQIGWSVRSDGELALAYERRFRGRDDES